MVYSKIYGFLPPSKMIDVDDGVAAVGYKSLSTPPLVILNRRTPLCRAYSPTNESIETIERHRIACYVKFEYHKP